MRSCYVIILVQCNLLCTGVARIFQQGGGGGPKRGSEATERGEGVVGGCPPSHGREIFVVEISCIKMSFFCTLNAIMGAGGGGVGYVKWHIYMYQSPTSPLLFF